MSVSGPKIPSAPAEGKLNPRSIAALLPGADVVAAHPGRPHQPHLPAGERGRRRGGHPPAHPDVGAGGPGEQGAHRVRVVPAVRRGQPAPVVAGVHPQVELRVRRRHRVQRQLPRAPPVGRGAQRPGRPVDLEVHDGRLGQSIRVQRPAAGVGGAGPGGPVHADVGADVHVGRVARVDGHGRGGHVDGRPQAGGEPGRAVEVPAVVHPDPADGRVQGVAPGRGDRGDRVRASHARDGGQRGGAGPGAGGEGEPEHGGRGRGEEQRRAREGQPHDPSRPASPGRRSRRPARRGWSRSAASPRSSPSRPTATPGRCPWRPGSAPRPAGVVAIGE